MAQCQLAKTKFLGKVKKGRGRKSLIQADTPEATLIFEALEQSLSITECTPPVNLSRQSRNLPSVSWTATENFTLSSESVKKMSRRTKKSGKDDADSTWAKCRMAEAEIHVPQHEVGDNADDTFGEVFSTDFTLSDDFQPLESMN